MSRFVLEILTDDVERHDVAKILEDLAVRIRETDYFSDSFALRDSNGNKVGESGFTED